MLKTSRSGDAPNQSEMPILPSHHLPFMEQEYRSRATAIRIRRLALSFSFLLALICACFIILGTLVTDSSKLNLTSSLLQTFTYSLRISFTPIPLNPSLEVSITDGYSWEPLHSGEQCLRFATREYTSKLVTPGWPFNATEAMKACREIPIELHGKALTTSWCQDLGAGRGVFGFWIVDFNEPECETRWGEFNDLGCSVNDAIDDTSNSSDSSEPARRIESRLENLQPGSDWKIMCVTTPAEIYGRYIGGPAACTHDPQEGAIYGKWKVPGESSCNL